MEDPKPEKQEQKIETEIEPMVVEAEEGLDDKFPHHNPNGSVDHDKVSKVLNGIDDGLVTFAGPYHDRRKREFRDHLIAHC